MTLGDVAAKLGMTTPSVRYYFRNKEDLAAACLLRAIARFTALIDEAAEAADPRERFRRFVRLYVGLLRRIKLGEAPPLANFSDVRTLMAQNMTEVIDADVGMFRRMRQLLRAPELEGLGRDDRNARAYLLVNQTGWIPAWIDPYPPEDYPHIAERIADVCLDGLAAAPMGAWAPRAIASLPAAPPRDARPLSRETFLIAATELINEEGYRGASIDRIAARLGVTKGAIYHRHEAKGDLIEECFARSQEIVFMAQTAAMKLEGTGLERVIAVSAALAAFQLSPSGPLLVNAAFTALPEMDARRMLVEFDRAVNRYALMISDGVIDGSIRRLDAAIAAQVLHAGVNSVAMVPNWVADLRPERIGELYLRPLLSGVFNP
jgi:AcrR family transcriptional regulator